MTRKLTDALDTIADARRNRSRRRKRATDGALRSLSATLVSARTAANMTQHTVATLMGTTKSAVSRLEAGTGPCPTLATIERYARAVNARLDIKLR
jgi:DNA-binding XRE family transcriptional regulator